MLYTLLCTAGHGGSSDGEAEDEDEVQGAARVITMHPTVLIV
jgi:hypothetical protein